MEERRLGIIESRFANLIWERIPITTGELVKLGQQELGWKRSTTYTVLKRLCDKGLFRQENGLVTARLTRQEFDSEQSTQFVRNAFQGSLPAFLVAFTRKNKLSPEEAQELHRLIDQGAGESHGD